MSLSLSKDDWSILIELCRKSILKEEKMDVDLSRTLVVTDVEHPLPDISMQADSRPMFVIANVGGPLILDSEMSDALRGNPKVHLGQQILSLLPACETLVFVLYAPSFILSDDGMTFVHALELLMRIQLLWASGPAHHRMVRSFLCVERDRRCYTYEMNAHAFSRWLDEYETVQVSEQDPFDPDDSASDFMDTDPDEDSISTEAGWNEP